MMIYGFDLAAIIAATVAAFALGGLWYSPLMFGNVWLKAAGISEKDCKEGMTRAMTLGLLNTLMMIIALAALLRFVAFDSSAKLVIFIILGWLAFTVSSALSSVIWTKRDTVLVAIEATFTLAAALVAGLVLLAMN